MPEVDYQLLRFIGAEHPAGVEFEMWRDLVSRKLLRASLDRLGDDPYRVTAALRLLPTLRVGIGSFSPTIHHRPHGVLSDENDDIALLVNLHGAFVVRSRGEDISIGAGDGFIIKCREAGAYVMTDPGRHLVVRLGPDAMGAFAEHAERAVGAFVPATTEGLRLLRPYARGLMRGAPSFSPAATQLVTQHVSDLFALVVGATGEAAEIARGRGLAAARLAAAKGFVSEHLGRSDLSETAAAAAQGITPRYLRRLFAARGDSFSAYVLERRLSLAHAMLTSRRFSGLTISEIAFEVGFGDLSYFNRVFRRRFGRTPRDARAEAAETRRDEAD